MNWLNFLVSFLSGYDEGRLWLPAGRYEIFIPTKFTPRQVWVSEAGDGNIPVCGGGVNLFGTILGDDGFTMVAEVQTDSVDLYWWAVLDPRA
jgi:hypothetical protein